MKTAPVARLKAGLSRYLRLVKSGEEILVTEIVAPGRDNRESLAIVRYRTRDFTWPWPPQPPGSRGACQRHGIRVVTSPARRATALAARLADRPLMARTFFLEAAEDG
jgi:antitoxin (DNA-binding transcriptional repressor) of toxin-antitoxin stability system